MVATSEPLIPNEIAQEIFEAHSKVVSLTTHHVTAKLVLKAAKEQLEEAQERLAGLITEAKSGQTRLL